MIDTPGPSARSLGRRRVVFFHAHPDDEAIFTGGTIAMLAAMGCSVTVVVATSGQLGRGLDRTYDNIGRQREAETRAACGRLGVERVQFLRYRDSGMPGDPANGHPEAFFRADVDEAAHRVAMIAGEDRMTDLVVYDAGGIYGHPDHVQVHRVGTRAAQLAGVATLYESTVDRDYLQRAVRSHLVSDAHRSLGAGRAPLGVPSGVATTLVGIGHHLDAKRRHDADERVRAGVRAGVVHPEGPGRDPGARRPRIRRAPPVAGRLNRGVPFRSGGASGLPAAPRAISVGHGKTIPRAGRFRGTVCTERASHSGAVHQARRPPASDRFSTALSHSRTSRRHL